MVIALLASGTFFVAREAKQFVETKVDEEEAARCKAMRAEYQDAWNRAVDSGRFPDVEQQLAAMERDLNAKCGKK
ncbi:MAG: hypothetical protein WBL74_06245 [Novosphingobium sp.]|uniref:hypothetical protein n=1 Tax=Novosphingobium sp. TaxID=1874826 RepID=UPI003C7C37B5